MILSDFEDCQKYCNGAHFPETNKPQSSTNLNTPNLKLAGRAGSACLARTRRAWWTSPSWETPRAAHPPTPIWRRLGRRAGTLALREASPVAVGRRRRAPPPGGGLSGTTRGAREGLGPAGAARGDASVRSGGGR
jgi:hypothetical protein